MATSNSAEETSQVLLLFSKATGRAFSLMFTFLFLRYEELIKHVCENLAKVDTFDIHMPGGYLTVMLNSGVHLFVQVRRVYVYYGSICDLKDAQRRHSSINSKLQFCLERDLEKQLANAETRMAVDPAQAVNRGAIGGIVTSITDRLRSKGAANDIDDVNPRFICAFCKLVLDIPYQLTCGHRYCRSCTNDQIQCATCSEVIANDPPWLDRGLLNEMEPMSETCTVAGRTRSLPRSLEDVRQTHQGLRNCVNASQPVHRHHLDRACLIESDAENRSALPPTGVSNSSNEHNDHISNRISTLVSHTHLVQGNLDRLQREHAELQNQTEIAREQSFLLHTSVQQVFNRFHATNTAQFLLDHQLLSMKENLDNRRPCFTNGFLVWNITNFQEKRKNAISERQKSIYSPVFLSSPTGYNMCLRAYLNGDGTTRDRHISIFFVLVRGEFDAILSWPFTFKLTLTLVDPSSRHDSVSKSFCPSATAPPFQRPTMSMNEPYGFPQFLPLDFLDQNYSKYVVGDTMFLRADVDFTNAKPNVYLPHEITAVANDEEHVGAISEDLAL